MKSFATEGNEAAMDMAGDDADQLRRQKAMRKWCVACLSIRSALFIVLAGCRDRKKKKWVGTKDTPKIRTESGQKISASYKTGIYDDWLGKHKADRFVAIVILVFFAINTDACFHRADSRRELPRRPPPRARCKTRVCSATSVVHRRCVRACTLRL